MNISRINLNLLVVLQALLETCNTTRASEKLFLTQSTVSNSLSQLRELFDDPLFIRKARGLEPTAKALQLKEPLQSILENIEMLFDDKPFDPEASEKVFTIAMSDYCEAILLSKLQQRLSEIAPHTKLIIKAVGILDFLHQNNDEHFDLLLGGFNSLPSQYQTEAILTESAVCLASNHHPLMQKNKITLKQYLNAKHITVYFSDNPHGNVVDLALKQQGLERQVDSWLPHVLAAAHALIDSDYLLTITKSLATELCKTLPLAFKPITFLNLEEQLHQVWHKRFDNDPANRWLREQLRELV